jgi:hemolysin III
MAAPPESARVSYLLAERPRWRGKLHAWAFVAAVPAGVLLILAASGTVARTAATIYIASLLAVFGTSAAYHRLAHSYRAREIMQRLDHSMIYLLIAGTYAPICLVALPRSWGLPLMGAVGGVAVVGMVLKLSGRRRLDRIGYVLYPTMGWAAVAAIPAMVEHLTVSQLLLVIGGGVAYSIGFPVLLLRRPDPWPKVFGYHEVWHGLTIIAAILHFGAVALVVA